MKKDLMALFVAGLVLLFVVLAIFLNDLTKPTGY